MSDSFNPYQKWFGIPPDDQPPNHYRLLGLELYEDSQSKIEDAVAAQVEFLQAVSMGEHVEHAQRILSEVAMARICLVDPVKKHEYDSRLRSPVVPSVLDESIPLAQTIDSKLAIASAINELEVAIDLRHSRSDATIPFAQPPRSTDPVRPTTSVEGHSVTNDSVEDTSLRAWQLAATTVVVIALIGLGIGFYLWNGDSDQPVAKTDQTITQKSAGENRNVRTTAHPVNTNDKPNTIGDSKNDQPKERGGNPAKQNSPANQPHNHAATDQPGSRSKDILFEDFETNYDKWEVKGTAFSDRPTVTVKVSGYRGTGLADSYHGGDGPHGTLLSEPFKIERRFIHFLCEGGNHPGVLGVQLLLNGETVQEATGTQESLLRPVTWDVKNLVGKTARLRILDARGGRWGCFRADHFVFSDYREHYHSAPIDQLKPITLASHDPIPNKEDTGDQPADTIAPESAAPESTANSTSGDGTSASTAKTELASGELVPLSNNTKAKDLRNKGNVILGKPFWTPGKGIQSPAKFKAVNGDLLESSLLKITRDNGAEFKRPDWHNGITDEGSAYDVVSGHGENGVEIHFDLSGKPGGFDIAEIRVFTAGVDNPSGLAQVSQSFNISYQLAADAGSHDNKTFISLGDVRAEPDAASTTGGILMTGTYHESGGPLISGVSAIKLATKNVKGDSGTNLNFISEFIQEIDIIEYSGVLGRTATLAMPGFATFSEHFGLPDLNDVAAKKIDDLKIDPSLPLDAKLYFEKSWSNPSADFQIRESASAQRNWVVSRHLSKSAPPIDVARLWIETEAMFFQWLPAAKLEPGTNYLRNGVLEFSVSDTQAHRLNFRSPILVEGFQLSGESYTVKQRTELDWLPSSKDLRIELLPFNLDKIETHCTPKLVTGKPAKMFFTKQQAEAFLWLELDGSVRTNKLSVEAELKLTVPDRRGKLRPQTFEPKLLNNHIAFLNQAINRSTQALATIKDANQKKQMQSVIDQTNKSRDLFESYRRISAAISDRNIAVRVFYEVDGHRVLVAKTGTTQK